MKRFLLAAAGAFGFIALLSAYVTLSVASDLRSVKETLDAGTRELEASDVAEAELRLRSANDRLNSLPARMLRVVPVVGQNVGSLREVVSASIPTLDAGLGLNDALEELDENGIIAQRRIQLDELQRLREPVDLQIATLEELTRTVRARRNGWLIPPLWNALDSLAERSQELLGDAQGVADFLDISDELLGGDQPRTYLVLLINNSELRGAGGILSGVGTIELRNGRLELGRFTSVHALRDRPPRSVPAPAPYERFTPYKANTTLWLNTTFSPSVPDVATVASRLYELKTGTRADGAITIDPRGVAALLPPDAEIPFPGTGVTVAAPDTARFIYSDAYELFEDQPTRRRAILALGRAAFSEAIESGLGGEEGLIALADALSGEHIRFNSFDAQEEEVLEKLEITGEIEPPGEEERILVTAQNFGGGDGQGTKLDFWARRTIRQGCLVAGDRRTECETTTILENTTPQRVVKYVGGIDGALRTYLETYVPSGARIDHVRVGGEDQRFRVEQQRSLSAVGIYIEVPRDETREISVGYSLPPAEDSFHLSVVPQPLTHDARLVVEIRIPSSWVHRGAGRSEDNLISFEGPLDRTLHFEAAADPRTGIPAIWSSIENFWTEPLF